MVAENTIMKGADFELVILMGNGLAPDTFGEERVLQETAAKHELLNVRISSLDAPEVAGTEYVSVVGHLVPAVCIECVEAVQVSRAFVFLHAGSCVYGHACEWILVEDGHGIKALLGRPVAQAHFHTDFVSVCVAGGVEKGLDFIRAFEKS